MSSMTQASVIDLLSQAPFRKNVRGHPVLEAMSLLCPLHLAKRQSCAFFLHHAQRKEKKKKSDADYIHGNQGYSSCSATLAPSLSFSKSQFLNF